MGKLSAKEMALKADEIRRAQPRFISVGKSTYRLRRLCGSARGKIDKLNKEVFVLTEQAKQEMTLRRAKHISRKMASLHAKTAAIYVLGRLWIIRPLYAIYWRWLHITKGSEAVFRINENGMRDPDMDFSLANWQITNAQLALSTKLIGTGMEEYQKRIESAEKQASEDGTPKSQESKSETSSNGVDTMSK